MNNIDQATKDRTAAWLKANGSYWDTTFVNNLLETVFSGERAWMDDALPGRRDALSKIWSGVPLDEVVAAANSYFIADRETLPYADYQWPITNTTLVPMWGEHKLRAFGVQTINAFREKAVALHARKTPTDVLLYAYDDAVRDLSGDEECGSNHNNCRAAYRRRIRRIRAIIERRLDNPTGGIDEQ